MPAEGSGVRGAVPRKALVLRKGIPSMINPSDLGAYVAAEDLALEIYRVTAFFPQEEKYGLTNQMRRAAVSLFSNLAEGCSRESQKEFARYVEMSLGSAMELRAQFRFAQRLGWLNQIPDLSTVEVSVDGMVFVLIRLQKASREAGSGFRASESAGSSEGSFGPSIFAGTTAASGLLAAWSPAGCPPAPASMPALSSP